MKDVGNYSRPMTDKERSMFQSAVDDSYQQFVGVVAEGRDIDEAEVRKFADGSIFTGHQALELAWSTPWAGCTRRSTLPPNSGNVQGGHKHSPPLSRETVSVFDLLGSFWGNSTLRWGATLSVRSSCTCSNDIGACAH